MRIVFGNWKYLFKNFWYVLACGAVPAIFLALSFDYSAISGYLSKLTQGEPRADFVPLLRVFSPIRIDSVLGGIYTICAYLSSSILRRSFSRWWKSICVSENARSAAWDWK